MNKAIWLLIVFFCAGFISCKSKMEGIELYFVDANGVEITETNFEIRPYIIWQPAYKDQDGGGYSLDSMSQAETFYNWFSVKIIIKNNSDEDIVLNKVEDKARYYGSYGRCLTVVLLPPTSTLPIIAMWLSSWKTPGWSWKPRSHRARRH